MRNFMRAETLFVMPLYAFCRREKMTPVGNGYFGLQYKGPNIQCLFLVIVFTQMSIWASINGLRIKLNHF